MNERWSWVIRYAVVIAAALILAGVFGDMALFKSTRFGKTGLNAARLVQFLGYGGGLFVLWLLARRVADLIPGHDARWNVLKSTLLPLTTLVVIAVAQKVMLLILGPLMTRAGHQIYSWVFISAIILSAVWLLAAVLTGSSSIASLFGGRMARRSS